MLCVNPSGPERSISPPDVRAPRKMLRKPPGAVTMDTGGGRGGV